jgi:outer membrane immunogenic protein
LLPYNYQIKDMVPGIEGDFQGSTFNSSCTESISGLGGGGAGGDEDRLVLDHSRSRWLRDGAVIAIADVSANAGGLSSSAGGTATTLAPGSAGNTLIGYAVGAGVEYALGGGWSIKGEYLHLGFGSKGYDISQALSGTAGPATVTGTADVTANVKASFDVARFGVNYKF